MPSSLSAHPTLEIGPTSPYRNAIQFCSLTVYIPIIDITTSLLLRASNMELFNASSN